MPVGERCGELAGRLGGQWTENQGRFNATDSVGAVSLVLCPGLSAQRARLPGTLIFFFFFTIWGGVPFKKKNSKTGAGR